MSPARRNLGRLKPRPTPAGVPVATTSPGFSVRPAEMVATNVGMSKIRSPVLALWRSSLATVFHACHRELCHFEQNVSFEIINVMEIIGESMGIHAEDIYKRLKMMDDIDQMIAECSDMIARHGSIRTRRVTFCWLTRRQRSPCRAPSWSARNPHRSPDGDHRIHLRVFFKLAPSTWHANIDLPLMLSGTISILIVT